MAISQQTSARIFRLFLVPAAVLFCLVFAAVMHFVSPHTAVEKGILLIGIATGSWQLVRDTYRSLRKKNFALDYIALLAITTGLLTGNFFVAIVIVLMMAGGNTLEVYAQERARRSLTSLSNRIPHDVVIINKKQEHVTTAIEKVAIGSSVLVRKGEIVPLDGKLISDTAVLDESSLTGEAFPVTKEAGDVVPSGVVNIGEALTLKTTVSDQHSTYRQIIHLVEQAQNEKTPFLQLADSLSGWFTLVTLALAAVAYVFTGDFTRVLAVLVIATPCPLILATPVALIGGMNAAASKHIIFKRLSALETLSRAKVMIFDKTGTLTLGIPELTEIKLLTKQFGEKELLGIVTGLERNSLHPYAKAILKYAAEQSIVPKHVTNVVEKLGDGLRGEFQNHVFRLTKNKTQTDTILITCDKVPVAQLRFFDELKPSSTHVLQLLQKRGLELALYTGDTEKRAYELMPNLPKEMTIKADCNPEEKRSGIAALKKQGKLVAMVGDGINDAPALALADVGIVFSHDERTAASEAADIIMLEGSVQGVVQALHISRHTLAIAKQSMYLGLGLSFVGMLLAASGHLPPITGAISQEVIDVAVILNALRAAWVGKKE